MPYNFTNASSGAHSGSSISQNMSKCYNRVIWGSGPRLLYNHALVTLRRATAELIRAFLFKKYAPQLPDDFTSSAPIERVTGVLRRVTGEKAQRPLRIAYYSRGNGPGGRSMPNESMLIKALRDQGAAVIVQHANKMSLKSQLEIAYHADVIMGVHGAGLVHAFIAPPGVIVVELKTVYAYNSDMFVLAADAARGVHVHVDISGGGARGVSMDEMLVRRVLAALVEGEKERTKDLTDDRAILRHVGVHDSVLAMAGSHGIDEHILGPASAEVQEQCKNSDYSQYWKIIGTPSGACLACNNK
jgi:hypothetical protein